ncbi:MAG: hypothetical protein HUN04_02155 [Desulfobacter sp.]|nr:MAG: hypothetical protein HUN04_02155 [Desulfobacter sp.]
MNILFTLIFTLSIAGAAAWGYYNQLSVIGYIISLAVAGFIGSSLIALIFVYLYFYQTETAPEQGEPPAPPAAPIAHIDPKEIKQIEK